MSNNHKNHKKQHFVNRMMERFAIDIGTLDLTPLLNDIENGINPPLIILENGNSFHFATIAGEDLVVLFDWSINYFLTPYRRNWLKQDENGAWAFVSKNTKKKVQNRERHLNYSNKNSIDERFVHKKVNRTFLKKGTISSGFKVEDEEEDTQIENDNNIEDAS